jgi:hypothetical protein
MRETLHQQRLAETRSVPPDVAIVPPVASSGEWIGNLRKIYPPLLTVAQYCRLRNCCPASAYNDFKKYPGLALKDGRATKVVRDVAFELLGNLRPWVPEKERAPQNRPWERSLGRIKAGTNHSDPMKPAPGLPANSKGAPAS